MSGPVRAAFLTILSLWLAVAGGFFLQDQSPSKTSHHEP